MKPGCDLLNENSIQEESIDSHKPMTHNFRHRNRTIDGGDVRPIGNLSKLRNVTAKQQIHLSKQASLESENPAESQNKDLQL